MAHQCLGCGRSFTEGAQELLKGCPGCKGTRFFYTPKALDAAGIETKRREAERDLRRAAEQMQQDPDIWEWSRRDAWIQYDSKKVDSALSLFSIARENATAAEGRPAPARGEVIVAPSGGGPTLREFVGGRLDRSKPMAPPMAPVRGIEEPVELPQAAPAVGSTATVGSTGATESIPATGSTGPMGSPAPVGATEPAGSIPAEAPVPPTEATPPPASIPAVEAIPATASPSPPGSASPDGVPAPDRVGSVRVERPGTYDIDVKGLLEASPVIIEREGVYVIHLPSVFESTDRRK